MSADPYLIPGTDTLRNKAGITDRATLDNFEREVTTARSFELIANPIDGSLDYDHLKDIHQHLFQDVYEWAGEPRTIGISKGRSQRAFMDHVAENAGRAFQWSKVLPKENDRCLGPWLCSGYLEAQRCA